MNIMKTITTTTKDDENNYKYYLLGRRPLRSKVAPIYLPSVKAIIAGPSHGSIRQLSHYEEKKHEILIHTDKKYFYCDCTLTYCTDRMLSSSQIDADCLAMLPVSSSSHTQAATCATLWREVLTLHRSCPSRSYCLR